MREVFGSRFAFVAAAIGIAVGTAHGTSYSSRPFQSVSTTGVGGLDRPLIDEDEVEEEEVAEAVTAR